MYSEKLSEELSTYYNALFCRFSMETATEVRQSLTYFSKTASTLQLFIFILSNGMETS